MLRSSRFAIVAAAAAILAGCAGGGPVLQPPQTYSAYTPQILNYAAQKGGMLVEVIGNPFQASKQDLDAVIADTLANSHFGQKIPFFTQAPANYTSPYRVVVALNPAPGTSAYKLCAGGVQTQARGPRDPDRVQAALCAQDQVVTSVGGYVFGPTGPRDPNFVGLIAQTSHALFPPTSPDQRQEPDREWLSMF
jgi:hypothetical protein